MREPFPAPQTPALFAADARGNTSLCVRRILEQPDEESWLWLVQRLNPLLEMQVEYRLKGPARRLCDPQDLINEAWFVAFMRLHTLKARNDRWTPVLLQFLSTTLLHKVNDLLRREIQRKALGDAAGAGSGTVGSGLPDRMSSVLSHAARNEAQDLLRSTLAELRPEEREVVVLRGIEQLSNQEAAEQLGLKPSAVAMRWARALERLRRKLPDSLFEDLDGQEKATSP